MEVGYTLNAEDFLSFQLFHASVSEAVRKRRRFLRFTLSGIHVLLGAAFFLIGEAVIGGAVLAFALLRFSFYSPWSKWLYKRHCRRGFAELAEGREEISLVLRLEEEGLRVKDDRADSLLIYRGLHCLYETEHYFFCFQDKRTGFTLPKRAEGVGDFAAALALRMERELVKRLDWRWV